MTHPKGWVILVFMKIEGIRTRRISAKRKNAGGMFSAERERKQTVVLPNGEPASKARQAVVPASGIFFINRVGPIANDMRRRISYNNIEERL